MTLVAGAGADALFVGQGGKDWAPTAAAQWTGRKIGPSARLCQLSFT